MFRSVLFTMVCGLLTGSLLLACGEESEKSGGGGTILDCAAACAKIDECARADSTCQQSCISDMALFIDSAARSIIDCITQSHCDGLDFNTQFYGCFASAGCFENNTTMLDASRSAGARCGCEETFPEQCAAIDDDLRFGGACFNEATTNDIVNCLASATCSSMDMCNPPSGHWMYFDK